MMLDKEMVGQVVQIVDRDAFYQADHQIILRHARQALRAEPPDRRRHRPRGTDQAPAATRRSAAREYLAAILNTVPSAAHGAHYAGIVREKALLRQLIAASNDILRDAYAPHEQADLVLDKAEKQIFEIAQKKVGNAMVADGGRAARSFRDDRKPRPARHRDRLLRTRRHAQRPAERRDDHRRRPPVDGKNRLRHEHHRARRRRQLGCPAPCSPWK